MKNCLVDPQDVLETVKHFNAMNKHLEKVLERCQSIQNNMNLLIQDKESIRLQITKEQLSASEGAETMHNCIENFKTLEQMRRNIDVMKERSQAKLKEIVEASKGFFENVE